MDALRATLDSTDGQVATVSRTSSPPPVDALASSLVAEYWCHTQVRVTKMKYIWTISNFSFCREEMGEVVKSIPFSCGPNDKLKWCLRINPKGLDEESREYLSLYLLLVNCGMKSEARAKFKFSLLNAKREETKAMESQRAYRFVQGKDWGFKKFIRRDALMDEANGLLPNDRLTILCEVSVVGETISESGQVNNQPITVPESNLHEDIGRLLFKQMFTDVTLVVMANKDYSNKCHSPNALTHACSSSHGSALESEQTIKHSHYDTTVEEEEEEAALAGDEADEEEDPDEDADELDDTRGFGDDEDENEDIEDNDSERDDDSQSSCQYNRPSCTTDAATLHMALHTEQQADRGEAEAVSSHDSARSVSIHNSQSQFCSSSNGSSNSTLAPATTTIARPVKGVILPVITPGAPVYADSECTNGRGIYSLPTQTLVNSPIERRLTPSSSNFSSQSQLVTTEQEGNNLGTPNPDDLYCRTCCHPSLSTPSNSSSTPSNNATPSSPKSGITPVVGNTDVVGSSSGGTVAYNTRRSCTRSDVSSTPTLTTPKESNETLVAPAEVETSDAIAQRRSCTRNRKPPNGNSATATSSRSSRNRSIRDRASTTTTVTKAPCTTSSSLYYATPSSSTSTNNQSGRLGVSPFGSGAPAAVGTRAIQNLPDNSSNGLVLRQFEVHKAILAARSPVFAAMFEHGMEESRANRVEITDVEPNTLAEVLRYIYTGHVVGLDKLAHELLPAADKYQLERLKTMCEEALVEGLAVENACDILNLADMHNAEQLKTHTLEFIMLHAHDVCETEGYEHLVRHRPRLLNECFRSLASQQLPLRCWARKRPRQS